MTAEYINSWSDDWFCTIANQSTSQTPTIDMMKRVMREFQDKFKDRGPDVLVLTCSEFEELKRHCEKCDPPIASLGMTSWEPTIYGIRIESYQTREEVRARVLVLQSKGVKAGFNQEE